MSVIQRANTLWAFYVGMNLAGDAFVAAVVRRWIGRPLAHARGYEGRFMRSLSKDSSRKIGP